MLVCTNQRLSMLVDLLMSPEFKQARAFTQWQKLTWNKHGNYRYWAGRPASMFDTTADSNRVTMWFNKTKRRKKEAPMDPQGLLCHANDENMSCHHSVNNFIFITLSDPTWFGVELASGNAQNHCCSLTRQEHKSNGWESSCSSGSTTAVCFQPAPRCTKVLPLACRLQKSEGYMIHCWYIIVPIWLFNVAISPFFIGKPSINGPSIPWLC